MAGETVITVVGNLTADPEIRTIAFKVNRRRAFASFTIAQHSARRSRRCQLYDRLHSAHLEP